MANRLQIVSKYSATLDFGGRQHLPHPIDANHSNCAKFSSASQHPFRTIANEIMEIIFGAIEATWTHRSEIPIKTAQGNVSAGDGFVQSLPNNNPGHRTIEPQQRGKELVYFKLIRYDTIFLVDDSTSMEDLAEDLAGIRCTSWSDTVGVMTQCAELILSAGGRLKVRFFNSSRAEEKVSGIQELRNLCRFLLRGDTLTYERMKAHLDEFIEDVKPLNAKQRNDHPGLNLIIFTDGAPEDGFEDIEELVINTARKLNELDLHKYKLGIQFVQIGKDESVTKFFEYIDNDIKGEHGLGQDVCVSTRFVDSSRYH